MGVKSGMLVYLLICTVRLTSTCTSSCRRGLIETCSNLENDKTKLSQGALPSLCADNIYGMITSLLMHVRRLSESSEIRFKYYHGIINNKISTICNSSLDTCQDLDVIGYTTINLREPSSEPITMPLLPVSTPCDNNPWGSNIALQLHVKISDDYNEWKIGLCAWGSSDTIGLNLPPKWTTPTVHMTSSLIASSTKTSPTETSRTSSVVTSPTKTSTTSTVSTSPTVSTMPVSGMTGPTAAAKGTDGVSSPSVVAIACGAFIMGVLCSLCVIFTLSMKRQNKMCFKVDEEPSPGKWEGASKPVTTKVIAKHLKTKTKEDQYEKIEKKDAKSATTSDQTYDNTQDHPRDSHVYSVLAENKIDRNKDRVEKTENSTNHVYLDISQHNLYESGRESSDSFFPSASFRNSNFAADENDIEAGEEKRDKYVNTRVHFSNNKHSPTDVSVIKEEEHFGGGPQQTKGDTKESTSKSETASTNNHESEYFILEKGISEPKESIEDNTYFKLEGRNPN